MAAKRKPAKKKPAARSRTVARSSTKPAARARRGATVQPISPCLWFDGQAEEAARFYVSVFRKGRITRTTYFPDVGKETHGRDAGSVMTVEFTINGMDLMGLNGGPHFKFNEAISLMVLCDTQEEIDYYWEKLSAGGDPAARQCGWLKDKFGLSWQVVPRSLMNIWTDRNSPGMKRAFAAMMEMKKLDIAALKAAYKGKT